MILFLSHSPCTSCPEGRWIVASRRSYPRDRALRLAFPREAVILVPDCDARVGTPRPTGFSQRRDARRNDARVAASASGAPGFEARDLKRARGCGGKARPQERDTEVVVDVRRANE